MQEPTLKYEDTMRATALFLDISSALDKAKSSIAIPLEMQNATSLTEILVTAFYLGVVQLRSQPKGTALVPCISQRYPMTLTGQAETRYNGVIERLRIPEEMRYGTPLVSTEIRSKPHYIGIQFLKAVSIDTGHEQGNRLRELIYNGDILSQSSALIAGVGEVSAAAFKSLKPAKVILEPSIAIKKAIMDATRPVSERAREIDIIIQQVCRPT